MLLSVQRNTLTNNFEAIVDRTGRTQHFEIARGKIAKQVEIGHLPIGVEEGVFGIVTGGGRSDDHPGRVEVLLPGDACRAGRSP